jgi:hypothetical protein
MVEETLNKLISLLEELKDSARKGSDALTEKISEMTIPSEVQESSDEDVTETIRLHTTLLDAHGEKIDDIQGSLIQFLQWRERFDPVLISSDLDVGFWAVILSSELVEDTAFTWTYTFIQVRKGLAGADVGQEAWSSKTLTGEAYNTLELPNGEAATTSPYGNGTTPDNLATTEYTFEVQPCPSGVVVWMRKVSVTDDEPEYWFTHENGVDGNCEVPF